MMRFTGVQTANFKMFLQYRKPARSKHGRLYQNGFNGRD